jgi:hypothetical protein
MVGQRLADSSVVADLVILQRHVEVHAESTRLPDTGTAVMFFLGMEKVLGPGSSRLSRTMVDPDSASGHQDSDLLLSLIVMIRSIRARSAAEPFVEKLVAELTQARGERTRPRACRRSESFTPPSMPFSTYGCTIGSLPARL